MARLPLLPIPPLFPLPPPAREDALVDLLLLGTAEGEETAATSSVTNLQCFKSNIVKAFVLDEIPRMLSFSA